MSPVAAYPAYLCGMAATLESIIDDLLDNADFEEAASLSKAQAFATAAKRFLILCPANSTQNGNSLSMNPGQVSKLLERADSFIASNNPAAGSRVKYYGFSSGSRR